MKKKILLFTLTAGLSYVALTSYNNGAAGGGGLNFTGAKSSVANCSNGGSCHGGTNAAAVASIRVDSAGGVAVNQYVAGTTYTVTVTGSHTSFNKFGFQYAVVSGSGSAQVSTGTLGTSFPSLVHASSAAGLSIVEHSAPITGTASSFSKSFTWTAPTTPTGDITMYLTVNAVNGNGNDDAADVSANVSKILTRNTTAVAVVNGGISVKTYPNPVSNSLNLQVVNGLAGDYTVTAYDLNGKQVSAATLNINGTAQAINTTNWAPGMYVLSIEKDGNRQMTTIVKQ